MNTPTILLIEDTQSDAITFIDRLQETWGDNVNVTWAKRLSEAMAHLESGTTFDQIWLDPGLPDLGERNVGSALATLKKFGCEVKMISSEIRPVIAAQAQAHNVQLIQKSSQGDQMLEIVSEMLSKRSNGTIKVSMAEVRGAVSKLEYQVETNRVQLDKAERTIAALATVPYELAAIKNELKRIALLQGELATLKTEVAALKKSGEEKGKLGALRIDLAKAIVLALIALGGTAITTLGPKIIDALYPTPNPPAAVSPAAKK